MIRGSNPGGHKIFHTHINRPWGPPGLVNSEYYWVSFPGVKWPGRGVKHPPPSSAEVKERVELFFYSPSGPVIGWTLPLPVGTNVIASTKMYPNTRGVGVSMAALNWLYVDSLLLLSAFQNTSWSSRFQLSEVIATNFVVMTADMPWDPRQILTVWAIVVQLG
jgi:hypothetical protein